MRRSASGSAAVWLLSCAPVALPALWAPAESSLGEASRTALCVIPWMAWIGLPGAAPEGDSGSSIVGTAALAVPPLASAAAIDLGHGRPAASLLVVAVGSLVMILLLGFAARRAAFGGRARAFAWTWLALVPGLPLLRCALELGGAPSRLAAIADASPIAWAWERAGTQALGNPWAALAVCLALLAIAGRPRGSET